MVMSIEDAKKEFRAKVYKGAEYSGNDFDFIYKSFDDVIDKIDPLNITLPDALVEWLSSKDVSDQPIMKILEAAEGVHPAAQELNIKGAAYSAYNNLIIGDPDNKIHQSMVAAWYLGNAKFYVTYDVPGTDQIKYALISKGKLNWVNTKEEATPMNRAEIHELDLLNCKLIPVDLKETVNA